MYNLVMLKAKAMFNSGMSEEASTFLSEVINTKLFHEQTNDIAWELFKSNHDVNSFVNLFKAKIPSISILVLHSLILILD